MDKWEFGAVVTVNLYNSFLLGGTVWLVMQGWSPWWFVPAIGLTKAIRTGKAAEVDNG